LLPSLDEIRAARGAIAGAAIRTPLVRLGLTDAPAEIHLKLENLQPIGSFKIRGAMNALAHRERAELEQGVLTASAGNMAQGVAWVARLWGLPCTVVAPDTVPEAKARAVERLGARLLRVPFDDWWRAFETRSVPGVPGVFVHAFDDPLVMAGNGTIGLEILEDLPDVEAIVVPWGGGGLACGIAAAAKALRPSVKVYAAEVDTAAPLSASLLAGSPQRVPYQPSFVDGIGSKTVFASMFERARGLVDGAIVSSLAEVGAALKLIAERNHVIAEGAGGASVAAALSGRAGAGKIACIVSGGNIDLDRFGAVVAGKSG